MQNVTGEETDQSLDQEYGETNIWGNVSKKDDTNDSKARQAIEILSEKDLKISGLKQQLRELKSRNTGLVNCLKNQDSAVRKLGSLVASRSSSEMSDVLDLSEAEDVIDTAFKKVLKMDQSFENKEDSWGKNSCRKITLSGEIKLTGKEKQKQPTQPTRKEEFKAEDDTIIPSEEDVEMFRSLEAKIRKLEDDIFARETAFRHLSKEKPINDEILNLRLDQIREERDKLYGILKHYERIMLKDDPARFSGVGSKVSDTTGPRSIKIDAAVTINNGKQNWPNREELLYHIEELWKCLEELRNEKKKKYFQKIKRDPNFADSRQKDGEKLGTGKDGETLRRGKVELRDAGGTRNEVDTLRADWSDADDDRGSKLRSYSRESDVGVSKGGGRKQKEFGENANDGTEYKPQSQDREDDFGVSSRTGGSQKNYGEYRNDVTEPKRQSNANEGDVGSRNVVVSNEAAQWFEQAPEGVRINGKEDILANDVTALRNEAALFARKLHDTARDKDRVIGERDAARRELTDKMKENEQLNELVMALGHKGGGTKIDEKSRKGTVVENASEGKDIDDDTRMSDKVRRHENELKKYQEILEKEKIDEPALFEVENRVSCIAEKPGVLSEHSEGIGSNNEVAKVFSHRIRDLEESNADASATINKLKNELAALKDRDRLLEAANDGLVIKVKDLQATCSDKDELLEVEKSKNDILEKLVEETARGNRELEGTVLDLGQNLKDLVEHKVHLESKVTHLEAELGRTKQQLLREKEERDLVEDRLVVLRDKETEISRQAEDLRSKVGELQKLANSFETERNIAESKEKRLRANLDEQLDRNIGLENRITELERCLAAENEHSRVLEKMKTQEEVRCREMREEFKAMQTQYQIANNENEGLKKNAEDAEKQIQRLQKEVQELREDKHDLSCKIEEIKSGRDLLQNKLNSRNEEVIEVQRDLGLRREKQNEAKRELSEKNLALVELKRELKKLKENNNSLKTKKDNLEEEKELAVKAKDAEKEIADSLREELGMIQDKSRALIEEIKGLHEALNVKDKKLETLETLMQDMSLEKGVLEKEVVKLRRDITDKTVDVKEFKEKGEILEESVREAQRNLKKKEDELTKLRSEYELLEVRYQEGQRDFIGLQKQLENCWQKKDDTSKELENSIRMIEELRAQLDKAVEDSKYKDSELEELKYTTTGKGARINELTERIDDLSQLIGQKDDVIQRRESEITDMNERLGLKEADNLTLSEDLRSLQGENTELKYDLSKLRGDKMGLTNELISKTQELEKIVSGTETLKAKHKFEIDERIAKWQLCEEYNKSLKNQLDNYKNREVRMRESGRLMKEEVGYITGELKNAKMILKDFQSALLDKDNDLQKINDAVVLLERSYAARQLEVQRKLCKVKGDFDVLTKENKKLRDDLVGREKKIETLMRQNKDSNEEKKKVNDVNLKRISHMEGKLKDKDKEIFFKDGKINMMESEISRLKMNLASEGKEVEGLIDKLERTLKGVKLQLENVEREKAQLKNEVDEGLKKRSALEESIRSLVGELSRKRKNTGNSRDEDFQEKDPEVMKMVEGEGVIRWLKEEIFCFEREKDVVKRRIEKERDEEILQKTSEKIEKENLKIQMKTLKEELENLKKASVAKDMKIKDNTKELGRLFTEREDRGKEYERKESEYKRKLEEMARTIAELEKKINKAVRTAENERYEREAVLAQLVDSHNSNRNEAFSRNMGHTHGNMERLESAKWRERAKVLTEELHDLQHEFTRYRNKSLTDREGILSVVETAKAEQIMNLKKELAETYKDKLAYQSKLNNLSSEIDKQRDEKCRCQKSFDALNEEYRSAKKEILLHKSEIDWLRNALSMKNTVS